MGEIADLVLAGEICQLCSEELGSACGYPRTCRACGGTDPFGAPASPRPEDLADYLQVAEQHGWTHSSHNGGYHLVLRRGDAQINVFLSSRRGPHWCVAWTAGKAKPVHLGLLEALTKEAP